MIVPQDPSTSNAHIRPAGPAPGAADIYAALQKFAQLLDPRPFDGVVELTVKDVARQGSIVGYFDCPEKVAHAANSIEGNAGNFYLTVNPVRKDLLARARNRPIPWAKHRTSDADVIVVRYVYIDIDPTRPAGVCATDAEKAAAWALTETVLEVLNESKELLTPIIADSGNGFCILLPILPLPVGQTTTTLIAELYTLLDKAARRRLPSNKADTATAKLDTTVSNPGRLVRFIGTLNRKGENVPEIGRSWRRSWLLQVPAVVIPSDLEGILGFLRNSNAGGPSQARGPAATGATDTVADGASREDRVRDGDPAPAGSPTEPANVGRVRNWLNRKQLENRVKDKTGAWRWIFELRFCPFHPPGHADADDHQYECCLTVGEEGRLGASCKHDPTRGWKDFTEAIGDWAETPSGPAYRVAAGQICELRTIKGKDGDLTVEQPLCNFDAKIVRDIHHDGDDGGIERTYRIEGTIKDGQSFAGEISAAHFDDRKAQTHLATLGGAGLRIYPRMGEKVIDGIRALSSPTRETVYNVLGWRLINGVWCFVTPTATIYAGGTMPDIYVDVGEIPALKHIGLPPNDAADVRGVVVQALGLLALGDPLVTYPTTSLAMSAPIIRHIPPNPVHLTGATGVFKTETSTNQAAWLGAARHRSDLVSWTSTAPAITKAGHILRDHLLVIDDLKNPKKEVVDQILQNAGDRTGRMRMKADLTLRKTFTIRAAVLSNGENLPQGEASVLARILIVRAQSAWCTPAQMSEAQLLRPILPFAMRAFIIWLARRWVDMERDLAGECSELRDQLRQRLPADSHARVAETMASVAMGLSVFLTFAEEIGAVSPAEAQAHGSRLLDAVLAAGGATASASRAERASSIYLDSIDGMLVAGQARLDPRGQSIESPLSRMVPRIGWVDLAGVYLEPDVAFTMVLERLRRAGVPLEVSKRALHAQLFDDGFIAARSKDEFTTVVRVGSGQRRVLHLRREALQATSAADQG